MHKCLEEACVASLRDSMCGHGERHLPVTPLELVLHSTEYSFCGYCHLHLKCETLWYQEFKSVSFNWYSGISQLSLRCQHCPVSDYLHCHENCMAPMVLFFDSITSQISLSGVLQAETFGLGTLCWSLLLRDKGWFSHTDLPLCFWQIWG